MIQTFSRNMVSHRLFQPIILIIILLNAVLVGLETYDTLYQQYRYHFFVLDIIILAIFTVEIALKMIAEEKTWHFFKDGWNVFDFLIVLASYIFLGSAYITV